MFKCGPAPIWEERRLSLPLPGTDCGSTQLRERSIVANAFFTKDTPWCT